MPVSMPIISFPAQGQKSGRNFSICFLTVMLEKSTSYFARAFQGLQGILSTDFRHTATLTSSFEERIFCALCGNSYHLHKSKNYIYWKCRGKYLTGLKCKSRNYTDFQLRQIFAYILGIEDFSETLFAESVEKIIVLENGDLEYHFKDGRIKTWQRV